MHRPAPIWFLLTGALAACASRNSTSRQLIDAPFIRQDSSVLNRSVDALIHYNSPFSSLAELGPPTQIAVTRGDSTHVFSAILLVLTLDSLPEPDLCRQVNRALIAAWRPLPSGAGIDGITLWMGAEPARKPAEFVSNPQCPAGGLHHPQLSLSRIVERDLRPPGASADHGTVHLDLGRPRRADPCTWKYLRTWTKTYKVRCQVARGTLSINAGLVSTSGPARRDTLIIHTHVSGVRLRVNCRDRSMAGWFCGPEPPPKSTEIAIAPPPPPPPPNPPRPVTVRGRVIDSVTGAPMPGVMVHFGTFGRFYSDSAGRFTTEYTPSRVRPVASCELGGNGRRIFSQDSVTIRERMSEILILIPPGICFPPLPASADSVFVGDYESGFELSDFRICGGFRWKVWADFPDSAYRGFAGLRPKVRWSSDPRAMLWTVRGKLVGPGMHGHLGVSEYQLTIARVLDVRPKRRGECAR